jgi:uncharacterized membrane protein
MKLKLAQFSTIILFALVMGVFWGTWFALSRSMAELRPETFLENGHAMIHNLGVPMSILMPLSLVSAVVLVVLSPKRSKAFALAVAALILMVCALLVTLGVEVPIDNRIEQWTVATLPSDWQAIRDRWEFYHTIRTFVSIAALGLVVASSFMETTLTRVGTNPA